MAKVSHRVFALSLALLFFVTAFGFSFYVIWHALHSNGSSSSSGSNTSQNTCQDNQPEPTLPLPAVYKVSGTVSKLQATDLAVGTGQTAKLGDCLVVKYYGTLAQSGAEFDENFDKPTAFAFTLSQGQVIQGWVEGLVGMKVGGIRRLVIPASLAYGNQSPASTIPANSDLVFVVKLLRIQA